MYKKGATLKHPSCTNPPLERVCFLMAKKEKSTLTGFFEKKELEGWKKHWKEMPDYFQEDKMPIQKITLNFQTIEAREDFAKLIKQNITSRTKSITFPYKKKEKYKGIAICFSKKPQNPQYPVYIISKGRWESRLTAKTLEEIKVPYHIVIEPQEYEQYAAVINPKKILILPFSNLGQGSIPARNWVWEHSITQGAEQHWILDDNIRDFYRMLKNIKYYVQDGTIFRCIEDFVNRYENIGLAGMQYQFFYPKDVKKEPFTINTRIYSCILINNSLPFRWRGKYNEDTDLSLRVLKNGLCTILFNAFLCGKQGTMRMSGGNTDELYKGDGRLKMAESLVEQHPDLARVTYKWGREQHHVDYSIFQNVYKQKLKLKKEIILENKANNYGMQCIFLNKEEKI